LTTRAGARKQHGFAPLGAADGPIKNAILGGNIAALFREVGEPADADAARPTPPPAEAHRW
jgi:hypothetical protein